MGLLVGACAEATPERHLPTTEVVDGVEIATLQSLPDLLDPDYFWHPEVVRQVRTVLAGVEEPLLFDPGQLVVLEDGTLFVLDSLADRPLVVFDPETETALARFGRRGRGPADLGQYPSLAELHDGTLAVFDFTNRRIHRYDRHGIDLGGASVDGQLIGRSSASPDGTSFVVETLRSREQMWSHDLHHVDPVTGADELLLRLPALPSGPAPTWQSGRALWTALEGGIVGMWGGETRFTVYDSDGGKVREVHLPLTTRTLTEPEIQSEIRVYGDIAGVLEPGRVGFTNFLWSVNDSVFGMLTGNLWRAAEDPEVPAGAQIWSLFTLDGEYIGVMDRTDVVGRGVDGTFWVKSLDEDFYPVLQEVRLVRGGQMEVSEEAEP